MHTYVTNISKKEVVNLKVGVWERFEEVKLGRVGGGTGGVSDSILFQFKTFLEKNLKHICILFSNVKEAVPALSPKLFFIHQLTIELSSTTEHIFL